MSWVMRSPSCSQSSEIAGQVGALRVVGDQVAQQHGGALRHCAPASSKSVEQLVVDPAAKAARIAGAAVASACPLHAARSRVFHTRFTAR